MFADVFGARRQALQDKAVVEEALGVVAAFGSLARDEVGRRRIEANSFRAARYWDRVEAEIDRRLDAAMRVAAAEGASVGPDDACRTSAARRGDEDERSFDLARAIDRARRGCGDGFDVSIDAVVRDPCPPAVGEERRDESVKITLWGCCADLSEAR